MIEKVRKIVTEEKDQILTELIPPLQPIIKQVLEDMEKETG